MASQKDDGDLGSEEIEERMRAGIFRALNTPPMPTKELVGKGERATAQKGKRVKGPLPAKPKSS
jgi:hypothetical protein